MNIQQLYEENFERCVKHYTHVLKGDVMAAEDIVHDGFVRALTYQDAANDRDKDMPLRWLIFHMRKAYLAWKREGKYTDAPQEVFEEYKKHLPEITGEYNEDEVLSVEESEVSAKIREVVRDVKELSKDYPEMERKALELYFTKGYRASDLTEVFGQTRYYFRVLIEDFANKVRVRRGVDEAFIKGEWVIV